jgi:hypothetical protein
MTEKTETKQPDTATDAPEASQQSVDLTVQDLALMKNIIDLCSTRGAFKPAEMAAVGGVYNKLSAFLETVNKGQPQNG